MIRAGEVLAFLVPNSEWKMIDNDFDTIEWYSGDTVTKKEFEAGFAKVEAWNAEQEAKKLAAKESAQEKLAALGLTIDDLKALGL